MTSLMTQSQRSAHSFRHGFRVLEATELMVLIVWTTGPKHKFLCSSQLCFGEMLQLC